MASGSVRVSGSLGDKRMLAGLRHILAKGGWRLDLYRPSLMLAALIMPGQLRNEVPSLEASSLVRGCAGAVAQRKPARLSGVNRQ